MLLPLVKSVKKTNIRRLSKHRVRNTHREVCFAKPLRPDEIRACASLTPLSLPLCVELLTVDSGSVNHSVPAREEGHRRPGIWRSALNTLCLMRQNKRHSQSRLKDSYQGLSASRTDYLPERFGHQLVAAWSQASSRGLALLKAVETMSTNLKKDMVSLNYEVCQVLSILVSIFLSRVQGTYTFPHDRCLLQSTSVPITRSASVEWQGETVNAVCTGNVLLKKCEGKCESRVSPSVRQNSGYLKICRCCRETGTVTKTVTLTSCRYNGEVLTDRAVQINLKEMIGCSCQTCS
ncbi:hypothetical protein RRG08_008467 [Elysia crispata]|uniref:CTCK domain-containing protein n=1 Tax=Elysia crispata TaxID=231223 RepID=A0AAE0ZNS6_9GAST|nr:hypothetical protein RRG08_008467 [Elysia crispata]